MDCDSSFLVMSPFPKATHTEAKVHTKAKADRNITVTHRQKQITLVMFSVRPS